MNARRSRAAAGAIAFVASVAAGAACGTGSDDTTTSTSRPTPGSASPSTEGLDGPADVVVVVDVVDGDTLDVRLAGGVEERVRIIGVNAPEDGECYAEEATLLLADLVGGETVELVADESDRDQYGRLLRYVETAAVGDVGEALVRQGAAIVRVSAPDVAREGRLRAAEAEARRREIGLWAGDACGRIDAATGDVRIVGLRLDAEGDDSQNLNDEWVEVANTGVDAVALGGWTIRDESASHRFTFAPGFELDPGGLVRLRSGCGEPSETELFWCVSGSAVWNNDGDTALLLDQHGNVVDRRHDDGTD